jgi:hypothetical protein
MCAIMWLFAYQAKNKYKKVIKNLDLPRSGCNHIYINQIGVDCEAKCSKNNHLLFRLR